MGLPVRTIAILATLLLALPLLRAHAADLPAIDGRYVYAGDQAERQARDRAIDQAAEAFPRWMRHAARQRLDRSALVPAHYEFRLDGEAITIAIPGGSATTLLDGTPVAVESEGRSATLSRRLVDGGVESRAVQAKSSRTSLFQWTRDGSQLVVVVTLQSDRLTRPLVYRLSYRRP
jgi:hypothetical protein